MKMVDKQKRDLEIAEYLCTKVGEKENGKPIYHTLEEAGVAFNLASTHIAIIKRKLIGNDLEDGTRKIKEEYSNG